MSSRMNLAKASGVMGVGSTASALSLSRKSAPVSTVFRLSFKVLRTPAGIPAGPTTPYHCTASKPLKPASTMVGTSLSSGWRVWPVTAKARTRPDRMCGKPAANPGNMACVWPPNKSVNAGAMPR